MTATDSPCSAWPTTSAQDGSSSARIGGPGRSWSDDLPAFGQDGPGQFAEGALEVALGDLGGAAVDDDLVHGFARVGAVRRWSVEAGLVSQLFPSRSVMTTGGVHQRAANRAIAVDLRDFALHRFSLPEITETGRSPESNHQS